MGYNNSSQPMLIEKVIAVFSYLTCGLVGFIWIIIGAFLHQSLKPFLKFHVFQSIFLSLLFFLIGHALNFITHLIHFIPIIGDIVSTIVIILVIPIIYNISILSILALLFLIYLCIGVVRGELSYVPWVSGVIKYNIEN